MNLTIKVLFTLAFLLFISCTSNKDIYRKKTCKQNTELVDCWQNITLDILNSINCCDDTLQYLNYENENYQFFSPKDYFYFILQNRKQVLDNLMSIFSGNKQIIIEEIYSGQYYKYNISTSKELYSIVYKRDSLVYSKVTHSKYGRFAQFEKSIVKGLYDNKMESSCQYPNELIIISKLHLYGEKKVIEVLSVVEE